MPTSRKIAIILLSIITVVLAAVAVIVGIRLQQGQAPVDTSAISASSSSDESSLSSEISDSSSSLSSSSEESLDSSSSSTSSSSSSVTASAQNLTLVESSTPTALSNGGAVIDLTILVTNDNATSTNLDFLYDDLPSGITSSQVTNASPAASDISDTRITWTVADGIAAGTTSRFSYTITLTKSQVATFAAEGGYKDMVTAQYDDGLQLNNTITFNLTTALSILPDTGLFDTPYSVIAIGLTLILMGLLVNRYGLLLKPLGFNRNSVSSEEKFERRVMDQND